jgi:hypothetical protein
MPGGKGKSSGGKSSGGKVGADGNKKQQSHSSKAGLQVSNAQTAIWFFCNGFEKIWEFGALDRFQNITTSPHQVASDMSTTIEQTSEQPRDKQRTRNH